MYGDTKRIWCFTNIRKNQRIRDILDILKRHLEPTAWNLIKRNDFKLYGWVLTPYQLNGHKLDSSASHSWKWEVFSARKAHVKRTHESWRDSLSMTLMHLRGRSGAYCQLYWYQYLSPNFNMSIYVKADLKPFHSLSKCLVCEHIWQLISQYRGLHPFVPLHAERPATLWEVQKGCWTNGSWKGVALWIVTFCVFIFSFWLTVVSAISGNPPPWIGTSLRIFVMTPKYMTCVARQALVGIYILKKCTWHVINMYIYICFRFRVPPHPPCHGHGHKPSTPPPPCGMGGHWEGVGVIQPSTNSNVTGRIRWRMLMYAEVRWRKLISGKTSMYAEISYNNES